MRRTRCPVGFAGRGAHEAQCGLLSAHAPLSMESLRIYNTLARDKQTFVPLREGVVRMYVCGMTVYDYCHVGHARVMVVFDIVQRWFARAWVQRDLRAQHYRYRRQDHQACSRER
ncbi:hypothetical protein OKW34_007836 [Paraburkholderia youngii]